MRVLVATAALLVSAAATAHADTTQPGSYPGRVALVAGPVLVGDGRIAWAAQLPPTGNHYVTHLYSTPAAGGDVSDHGEVAEWTDEEEYSDGTGLGALAGGNGHIAWLGYGWSIQGSKFGSGYFSHHVSALTGGGQATSICGPGETGTMALSGDTLAISGCDGVTVRDLGRGTPPERLASSAGWVQVAGSHVAWWTHTGFELLDRATGTRTTLDARQLSGPRRNFAVSPEGVLAVTVGDVHNPHLVWASAAEPTWHTIPLPDLDMYKPIRVRGNRLVYMAYGRGASQLRLTDLAGAAPTLLAERAYDSTPDVAPFDFDGTTLTWADEACGALTVTARPITGPIALPNRTHCPVVVAGTARNGKIRLRCPAPSFARESDRCTGTVTVRGSKPARFKLKAYRAGTAQVKTKRRGKVQVTVRSVTRGHASTTKATVELR